MKTLYLHIGQPKTGTTAIQMFCSKNKDLLARFGVRYIDAGRNIFRFNHKTLWLSILQQLDPRKVPNVPGGELPELSDIVSEIRHEISTASNEKFLISFEGFSAAVLNPDESRDVLPQLIATLSEICVVRPIIYFRDPVKSLLSNYNQRCKASAMTPPFLDWVRTVAVRSWDQGAMYDLYNDVANAPPITRLFDQATRENLLESFFETMDARLEPEASMPEANSRIATDDLERSRIENNLMDVVPLSHRERFIFGYGAPNESEWDAFLDDIRSANLSNKRLFEREFDQTPSSFNLRDLIWHERQVNHRAATQILLESLMSET